MHGSTVKGMRDQSKASTATYCITKTEYFVFRSKYSFIAHAYLESKILMNFFKASKTDSYSLTEEARLEFENMFKEMKNEEKWELRAGVYVEDLMYEFGKQCTHEQ